VPRLNFPTALKCSLQGEDDLCQTWSIFYITSRLNNPDASEQALLKSMTYESLLELLYYIYTSLPFRVTSRRATKEIYLCNTSLLQVRRDQGESHAYSF